MELWIRSQDKTMLCKPQYIELQGTNEIAMGDINIGYRCVATYKSKERALEVLDEIQTKLDGSGKLPSNITDVSKQVFIPPFMVYEMPKD